MEPSGVEGAVGGLEVMAVVLLSLGETR